MTYQIDDVLIDHFLIFEIIFQYFSFYVLVLMFGSVLTLVFVYVYLFLYFILHFTQKKINFIHSFRLIHPI